jgi:hypothetical protein
MIFALLSVLALVWVAGIAVTVVYLRRAPVGFEDENGFHAVEEKRIESSKQLAVELAL